MTDLSKVLKRNKSGWLALTTDNSRVIAKGKTLREALSSAKKKGVKNPSMLKTAPFENIFIG
ncbi:MAG: hypothetical protein HYW86_00530 [Candidatus Roizmanbacteria bacterium]|nr:MAG: hypothetical protein HYW86_00530 [Candidatus Roizmanbacteria bacterium]